MAKETPEAQQPNPWEILQGLTEALNAAKSGGNEELQAKLVTALDRLAEAQVESGKLIASETRRALRPSNEVVPGVSVFNRRGNLLGESYQKPLLRCPMYLPWEAENESMTREEVELLNLLEAGTYIVKRVDNTRIKMNVQVEYGLDEKTPTKLVIFHDTAFANSDFRTVPPLDNMLRQMLKQHSLETQQKAAAVLTDDEEAAMIAAGKLTVSV